MIVPNITYLNNLILKLTITFITNDTGHNQGIVMTKVKGKYIISCDKGKTHQMYCV